MASDPKDPRKINFDAPLLSIRRPHGVTSLELCHTNSQRASWVDPRTRVPFSWELTAGKPKVAGAPAADDFPVPPPRPPPGKRFTENEYDGDDDFSDAIDTFSLSAAIDMVESAEVAKRSGNMLGGVSLEPSGNQSPSFIIQRFLTDAKALAISSGLTIPTTVGDRSETFWGRTVVDHSPKGCGLGLDSFLPWRTKHKPPCGFKSPVSSVNSQRGMKRKQKQKSVAGSSSSCK